MPNDLGQLGRVKDLSPGSIRRYGEVILELVSQARGAADTELPAAAPTPLTPAQTQLLKQMKALGEAAAEAVDVAPEVLLKKRDLEELIRVGVLPPALSGWRKPLVGDGLLGLIGKN
jgi:ribonuclease D